MKIFVISLPDADERRQSAQLQFDEAAIAFQFFDAIRGETAVRDCEFEGLDDASYLLNTGRQAVIGEIGCFASHRELWKRCVKLDEPVVIMEDDFNILPRFAGALTCANDVISDVGFLRLQTTVRAKKVKVAPIRAFNLERFTKAPHGLMCYCISPGVAKKFVDATRKIDAPVDVFVKNFWEHGQPLFALTPYTIAPSILSMKTSIVGRTKTRKGWSVVRKRFARKANWYRRRCLFNLRQRLRYFPKPHEIKLTVGCGAPPPLQPGPSESTVCGSIPGKPR